MSHHYVPLCCMSAGNMCVLLLPLTSHIILITVNTEAVKLASHYQDTTHTAARCRSSGKQSGKHIYIYICAFCVFMLIRVVCAFITCDYFWMEMMQCECLEGSHLYESEKCVNAESQEREGGRGGCCCTVKARLL